MLTGFASLRDGSILGLGGKSTSIDGYMPQGLSSDGGKTWVKSKTPFPAQAVNQRPSLLRLASGRLLFAADFQRRGNIAPTNSTERGSRTRSRSMHTNHPRSATACCARHRTA